MESRICFLNPICTKVATVIKGIKSRKAAGEDQIRREMLKELTGEGIFWLPRVCQAA